MNDHSQHTKCENCIVRQLNELRTLKKYELKKISKSKVTKKIKKGETLFDENEKLNGVFCIKSGVSKLSKMSDNGKDQIVKFVSKGDLLGQRSVISEETTNLSAIALNDMELCFIPKNNLKECINDNVAFTKAMLVHMASDLKFADDIIVNMAQKNVIQRIAESLKYLEDNFGVDSDGFISILLTREDISSVVGAAKEACIRTLTKLKKEGVIVTDGKKIKIINSTQLNRIIEGF